MGFQKKLGFLNKTWVFQKKAGYKTKKGVIQKSCVSNTKVFGFHHKKEK